MNKSFAEKAAMSMLYESIHKYIYDLIAESIPNSPQLKAVKNGTDYCRRLRSIAWARDLADAAKVIGVPNTGCSAPIEKQIESAARFLQFQKEEYFDMLSHYEGGNFLRKDGQQHLQELMTKEGVSPDPSIYREWP